MLIEAINKKDLNEFKKVAESMENPNFENERTHVIVEKRRNVVIVSHTPVGEPYLIERLADMDDSKEFIKVLIDTGKIDLNVKTKSRYAYYKGLTLQEVVGVKYLDLVSEEVKQKLLLNAVHKKIRRI